MLDTSSIKKKARLQAGRVGTFVAFAAFGALYAVPKLISANSTTLALLGVCYVAALGYWGFNLPRFHHDRSRYLAEQASKQLTPAN